MHFCVIQHVAVKTCFHDPLLFALKKLLNLLIFLGIFDTEMVTEALNGNNDAVAATYEIKTAPEDEDSVDIDTKNEIGTNPEYEYYYVYYDEDGNVVEKSPPKVIESAVLNGDKVQDIPLVSSTTSSTTTKNTASLNTNQLGDTPTIYASLGESSGSQESEKSEETGENEEEGMSIFGIPIPKIPFPILSFGLAPTTLSHGLLPIGRKGDPGSSESDSSEAGLNRKTGNQPEITRGPDTIDPIWLETLINAGKSYFASSSAEDTEANEEEAGTEIDRNFQQYFPNMKGYSHPQNPVIPLTSSEQEQDYQDIPIIITNSGPTEYYPQASQYVPAIKFDHPTEYEGPVRYPIRPAPDLQLHQYPAGPAAEDGFIPLFLPDQSDPIRQQTPPPAFPGIDSTLKLPAEGYKLPLYPQRQPALNFEYPLIYKKPPQQLPDSEIPIVYANNESPGGIEVQSSGESNIPQELPEYLAVPPEVPKKREYPIFKDKSTTELPIIKRSTKAPPTTSEAPPEYDYYYVYEDANADYEGTNPVQELLNNLGIGGTKSTTTEKVVPTEETTTERKVPTLQVEEVLPSQARGTTSTTTTTTEVPSTIESTTKPEDVEYEYEYYYEYYEDPSTQNQTEAKEEAPKIESAAATESSFSLKNFLNYITNANGKDEIPSTTEKVVTISNAGTTGMTIPKRPLLLPNGSKPTPAVPLRTSTELYENYLESQRSTVTVETTNPRQHENHRRLPTGRSTTSAGIPSSTPYPFRPDRLDPKGLQPHNNEVKWYYSNYNSEGLEPYIDPRVPREQDEAAHVQLSKAPSTLYSVFTLFMLPYLMLQF